jgi:hypothetical protein
MRIRAYLNEVNLAVQVLNDKSVFKTMYEKVLFHFRCELRVATPDHRYG